MIDAGYFLDIPDYTGHMTYRSQFQGAIPFWNPQPAPEDLNPRCVQSNSPADLWKCYFTQYFVRPCNNNNNNIHTHTDTTAPVPECFVEFSAHLAVPQHGVGCALSYDNRSIGSCLGLTRTVPVSCQVNNITTPFFATNSLYDAWQLGNVLNLPCSFSAASPGDCTPSEVKAIEVSSSVW
jgi:hypothetical protein